MAFQTPIVSPTGIIHVLGYTPIEGERGVPITVRIHFHPDLADAMYVRLVVGTKAVPTKVRLLPSTTYGKWQLHASAPPFDRNSPTPKVLLSVQALNEENVILDSATFGEFTYWTPGKERRSSTASISSLPRLQISEPVSIRRRANTTNLTPPPSAGSSSSPQRNTRLHRRMKSQSLVRTKQNSTQKDELYAQTPLLDLITPLATICTGWTPAEISAGRRLVRFSKIQDGRRLIVSCEPIHQEDYCENDSVISCIYRTESDTCYVTSVDVIYLLERLTNGEFPVEEKNRIRRNLEGLRPTTVSKHKPGFGDFFQRIMEFPDPKPRNIEKDLKVFEWNSLGQALEKILSKYSIYTSPPISEPTTPSPPVPAESPELYALQLSYPLDEEPANSRFLDKKMPKYEPFIDDLALATGFSLNPDNESFVSPVDSAVTSSSDSSSTSAFPLFSSGESSEQHPWTTASAEFKTDLENFNIGYQLPEPNSNPGFVDGSTLDFNIYDNYNFHNIPDDTLASLTDHFL